MNPKPETLSGLIAKDLQLWCYCIKCAREKILEPRDIIERQGDGPVPTAGSRWRCSCGYRPIHTKPHWVYESLHQQSTDTKKAPKP